MLYLQNGSEGTNSLKLLILNPIPLVRKTLKIFSRIRNVLIYYFFMAVAVVALGVFSYGHRGRSPGGF